MRWRPYRWWLIAETYVSVGVWLLLADVPYGYFRWRRDWSLESIPSLLPGLVTLIAGYFLIELEVLGNRIGKVLSSRLWGIVRAPSVAPVVVADANRLASQKLRRILLVSPFIVWGMFFCLGFPSRGTWNVGFQDVEIDVTDKSPILRKRRSKTLDFCHRFSEKRTFVGHVEIQFFIVDEETHQPVDGATLVWKAGYLVADDFKAKGLSIQRSLKADQSGKAKYLLKDVMCDELCRHFRKTYTEIYIRTGGEFTITADGYEPAEWPPWDRWGFEDLGYSIKDLVHRIKAEVLLAKKRP